MNTPSNHAYTYRPLESCIYIPPPRIMHIHTAPSNHAYAYRPRLLTPAYSASRPHLGRRSAGACISLGRARPRKEVAISARPRKGDRNLGLRMHITRHPGVGEAAISCGGRNLLRRPQSPGEAAISCGGRNLLGVQWRRYGSGKQASKQASK